MAVKKHGVHFDITAENATDRALRAVESNLGRVNKAADAVGFALRGAFLATAAITAGKLFADAAIQAEGAQKRLNAVLKATGGVAGMAAEQVHELADAMAQSTQFDDEALRNGAAQLAKFGTVHSQVFKDAMAISADLAAFMDTDFNTAVQSVGKALHSPAEGLGALEKQIGKIDPTLRKWLDRLVENGQVVEAQNLVLQTLRGRIGGVAEEMNTGLFKATNDVKKAWGEMLEAFGRTSGYQSTTGGTLKVVENYLVNIKDVVENGDWVEKVLGIAALVGGAGGHRRFNLSKNGPAAGQFSSGKIGGVRPEASPEQQAAGAMMMDGPLDEFRKRRAASAKEAAQKHLREIEDLRKKGLASEEEYLRAQHAQIEAQDDLIRNEALRARAERERLEALGEQSEIQYLLAQQRKLEERDDITRTDHFRRLTEEGKKASDAARDLGMTFVSAFEDAVLEGKKLSDVLKGLGKDIGRMLLRETVTKPAASAFGEIIKGLIPKFDVGTDYVPRDMVAMVHKGEAIIPASENRRGGGGQTINIYPDLRGASQEAVEALHRMVVDLRANVPGMALGAYTQARTRGRL